MMNHDIGEEIISSHMSPKWQPGTDERFQRDMQKDLHEGLDMMFNFAHALRNLHPDARKHIQTIMEKGEWL
jgi:hypothetical protein